MNLKHYSSMTKEKTCFIASTIGDENTEERKAADDKFDLVFEPILQKLGYKAVRADKIGSPNSISYDIVKMIIDSQLMIADVSDKNPNVFYELAVRNAIQKPVIVIKSVKQKMPFDIYDKRAISIDMQDARNWTKSMKQLESQIIEAEKDKENASKSILSDFSLSPKLETNLNPDAELGLALKDMRREIRRLREDVRGNNFEAWMDDDDPYFPSPRKAVISKLTTRDVIRIQLFMDVLKALEGDNRAPVEEEKFVNELVKSEKYTEESSRRMIRQMLREASIYESRPGHYNRV